MDGRRYIALGLVLLLTGSALALQQQKVYKFEGGDDIEARGVVAVQQHTVFTEFILEEDTTERNITEFAAVVGLVKKCIRTERTFDNAVLWFNDQFLFGAKDSSKRNLTKGPVMGENPANRTHSSANLSEENRINGTGEYNPETGETEVTGTGTGPNEGGNPDRRGFMRGIDNGERWGGCFIPDGFLHAVPNGTFGPQPQPATPLHEDPPPNTTTRWVKDRLHDPARNCAAEDGGMCAFTYEGSHYITDPNNHAWIIDRYDVDGVSLYTVHLQVDPWNPFRQGFADEAIWAYRDGQMRLGMPYAEDESAPMYDTCKDLATVAGSKRYSDDVFNEKADAYEYDAMTREGGSDPSGWAEWRRGPVGSTLQCSIEYNFLTAIDFNEISAGGPSVGHGTGNSDETDFARNGNSHPHNPVDCLANQDTNPGSECDSGPQHRHNSRTLGLFFDYRAPYFTEENPYWDQPANGNTAGQPPIVAPGCEDTVNPNDPRRPGVLVREPLICDILAFSGFHLHDGSQTVS